MPFIKIKDMEVEKLIEEYSKLNTKNKIVFVREMQLVDEKIKLETFKIKLTLLQEFIQQQEGEGKSISVDWITRNILNI